MAEAQAQQELQPVLALAQILVVEQAHIPVAAPEHSPAAASVHSPVEGQAHSPAAAPVRIPVEAPVSASACPAEEFRNLCRICKYHCFLFRKPDKSYQSLPFDYSTRVSPSYSTHIQPSDICIQLPSIPRQVTTAPFLRQAS